MTGGDIVLAAIGLVGGFLLSILLWWVTARLLAPKVEFSNQVSRVTGKHGTPIYRVQIQNVGRRRIIDLAVEARIRYTGVSYYEEELPKNRHSIVLKSSLSNYMLLEPGDKLQVRFYPEETIVSDRARVDGLYDRAFPQTPPDRTLEQLLSHPSHPFLVVDVLCFDAFSGARKHFRSPRYSISHVVAGKFSGREVVPFTNRASGPN